MIWLRTTAALLVVIVPSVAFVFSVKFVAEKLLDRYHSQGEV